MQEAHATEGLGQVRTDLDQLVVLTSGNVPTDVAALLASPQKGRWGSLERKTQDSDPTTPLGGQAFSVFNEDVSPVCQTSNWEVHQTRTAQTLPSREHSNFHFHSISSSGTKTGHSWIVYNVPVGAGVRCSIWITVNRHS